jgi:hypothetical protein
MKRKHRKVLNALFRTDGSVEMRKVEALLHALGGEIEDRGNGLYSAQLNDLFLVYDRPHPSPEVGRGLAKRLKEFLQLAGITP